ncbi:MAG: hypothetical protein CO095_00550 [Armatimonadetes bacterium CG_4_9_14_3_um_filter_58_7]|nr:MAG: hypothetical protein CO095_00550 [Armatimonadetes bacterium CG_4_9_14_3_um_filter_58_7]
MRAQDIIDIHISPRVAAKIWAKHGVSEEEVFEVFENPEVVPEIRGVPEKVIPTWHLVARWQAGISPWLSIRSPADTSMLQRHEIWPIMSVHDITGDDTHVQASCI